MIVIIKIAIRHCKNSRLVKLFFIWLHFKICTKNKIIWFYSNKNIVYFIYRYILYLDYTDRQTTYHDIDLPEIPENTNADNNPALCGKTE